MNAGVNGGLSVRRRASYVMLAVLLVAVLGGCNEAPMAPSGSGSNNYDISKLQSVRSKLLELGHKGLSVGYDQSGNISAWVDILEVERATNLGFSASTLYRGNYHTYTAKTILDAAPGVADVWLFTDGESPSIGEITHVSRQSYEKSGLEGSPKEQTSFNKQAWYNLADVRWLLSSTREDISGEHSPEQTIKRLCNEYFGDRLLDFPDAYTSGGGEAIGLRLNGLPENLEEEIARVGCLVYGLSMHMFYPFGFSITYVEDGIDKLRVEGFIATEAPLSEEEKDSRNMTWYDIELVGDNSSAIKFPVSIEVLDDRVQLPTEHAIRVLAPTSSSKDMTYIQVMQELRKCKGVTVLHLGDGDAGLTAVLRLEDSGEELNEQQLEIALLAMQMPIQTIWVIVDNGQRIVVSCVDRQRSDMLGYIGDRITIGPDDWPIVATYYWEQAKK